MPKIIKNGAVVSDDWVIIARGESAPANGKVIVNAEAWASDAQALTEQGAGLWLDSDQAPTDVDVDFNTLPVIAINFPAFADGRGYSYAHILRKELGYTGELRAIGDVLRDQLFYMQRCGFNAYAVREDCDINTAVDSLGDFSHSYQAAIDDTTPLFQKRWS